MVRDGYYYGSGFAAAGILVGAVTGKWSWSAIPFAAAAFFAWFFRDPERAVPDDYGLVVSPADGKLTEVARVWTETGERIRLSIFLSIFDVHVNRSPIAGSISEIHYRKGEYLNALNPESAARNEQNTVIIHGDEFDVTFKQIAGLLARRIVFRPRVGEYVERGERVGMIKFGSRVDVLLPEHAIVRVKPGQRVKCGSSVLAEVRVSDEEPLPEVLAETMA